MILVVASFAALITQGHLLWGLGGPGSNATATLPPGTATAIAVARFPYLAVAPGPGCDPQWDAWQKGSVSTDTATCDAQHTATKFAKSTGATQSIQYQLKEGIALPGSFAISVDVSGLSDYSNGQLGLKLSTGAGERTYFIYLNKKPDEVTVFETPGLYTSTLPLAANGAHTLAIHLADSQLTFTADDKPVTSAPVQLQAPAHALSAYLTANVSNAGESVTFANFRIQ